MNSVLRSLCNAACSMRRSARICNFLDVRMVPQLRGSDAGEAHLQRRSCDGAGPKSAKVAPPFRYRRGIEVSRVVQCFFAQKRLDPFTARLPFFQPMEAIHRRAEHRFPPPGDLLGKIALSQQTKNVLVAK